jgi:hypothetical protein
MCPRRPRVLTGVLMSKIRLLLIDRGLRLIVLATSVQCSKKVMRGEACV